HSRHDELSGSVDDRRARHGVPAPQRVRLLDVFFRRAAALFQLPGRAGDIRRWFGAGRRLGRVHPVGGPRLLTREQHGLLELEPARDRCGQYRSGDQRHRNGRQPALQGDEDDAHATLRLALDRHLLHDPAGAAAVVGVADHASAGPLSRLALLRHAGRRLRGVVATFLLGLRPPGSLHPDHSGLRLSLGDHTGFFPQAHLRILDYGRGDGDDRIHQRERLGAPYVHHRHDFRGQHLLRHHHLHGGRADRDQDLQLAWHDVRRQASLRAAITFLHRISLPVFDRRTNGSDAGRGPVRLAVTRFLLRRSSFPLHARRRVRLRDLRRDLLLVSEGGRTVARPEARVLAFLAVRHRVPPYVRPATFRRLPRHAAPHLYLRGGPGLG